MRSGRWAAFQGQLRDRPALVLVGVLLVLVVMAGGLAPLLRARALQRRLQAG